MTTNAPLHDVPIACTLSAADHRTRIAELSELAARALRSREPIDGGERLLFDAGDGVEASLRAAVAAEAVCCSFLTMRLERRADTVVLEVVGPAEAGPVIAGLFAPGR